MSEKFEKSLEFVVKHFRRGAFTPTTVWVARPRPWWRRTTVAASAVGVALVAAAAAGYFYFATPSPSGANIPAAEASAPVAPTAETAAEPIVTRIEFTDAPLSQVVEKIEEVYGVEISGLTPDEEQIRLTLSYEGTAADLIETINMLVNTNLTIEE